MKSTRTIVAAMMITAVTVIRITEGMPKPQDDYFRVDGFAFDGPIDGSSTTRSLASIQSPGPTTVAASFTTARMIRGTLSTTALPSAATAEGSTSPLPFTQSPEVTECIKNCRFRVTSEYNPVCGTDGSVYSNPGMLECAKVCGHDVDRAYHGPCASIVRG